MHADVKAKWVAALRSGEYFQAFRRLRSENAETAFCCLGVLCDLHAKETGARWVGSNYLGNVTVLPDEVAAWSRLGGGASGTLANMNDNGATFPAIADHIEKFL